jgi:phosphatidylglycerophosphatase A
LGRTISKEEKITERLSLAEQVVATGLFIGHVPFAPATWACAISVIIWYFTRPVLLLYIILTIALFFIGVVVAKRFEHVYGRDPSVVVIDEYACFLIPLAFVPRSVLFIVIAFLVFRMFDIIKPPPLRRLEHVTGGWGVMLDDLGAALYTSIVVLICRIVLHT